MNRVTLAILAGGEGRRMGMPKAQLRIQDKHILDFLLDRFSWGGPTLLVTSPGRENPPGTARFDREVIDPVSGEGPLRGILTALQATQTDTLILCTVDMPFLDREHIDFALNRLNREPNLDGLMFNRGDDFQPFPFACRRSASHAIERQLSRNRRSMHALAEMPGFKTEPAPTEWSARVWTNLNTPDDLSQALSGKNPPRKSGGYR